MHQACKHGSAAGSATTRGCSEAISAMASCSFSGAHVAEQCRRHDMDRQLGDSLARALALHQARGGRSLALEPWSAGSGACGEDAPISDTTLGSSARLAFPLGL